MQRVGRNPFIAPLHRTRRVNVSWPIIVARVVPGDGAIKRLRRTIASRCVRTAPRNVEIVRGFRTPSARRLNERARIMAHVGAGFKPALAPQTRTIRWQRGYYEHVIRNEKALDRVRAYIANNPARWAGDPENISRAVSAEAGEGLKPAPTNFSNRALLRERGSSGHLHFRVGSFATDRCAIKIASMSATPRKLSRSQSLRDYHEGSRRQPPMILRPIFCLAGRGLL
jgi:hypothetical protein